MKRLAIIPARGGSKRIPGKNIKDFCGKPMISHILEAAKTSNLFDTIHVSTDCNNIASICKTLGHEPDFIRPPELSNDHASMMEALRYVVEEYQKRGQIFDTVTLLYATSPLTDPEDLKKACAFFESTDKKKALLAIAPYPAPIEHAFRMQQNHDITPNDKDALAMRTQDLQHAYYDAGMFAFYSSDYILASKAGGDFTAFKGFEVPSYRVTDIDWPEDWSRAEALYRTLGGQAQ